MLTIDEIRQGLKDNGYIPNDDICYAVFAALSLNKPVLIEGDPGVGKTSLAIARAASTIFSNRIMTSSEKYFSPHSSHSSQGTFLIIIIQSSNVTT